MKFQHSGKEHRQHKPRLLPFSPAAFQDFLKNSFADSMSSVQDAFISQILLYRLASSFSPMRYHRNRLIQAAEKLFYIKSSPQNQPALR